MVDRCVAVYLIYSWLDVRREHLNLRMIIQGEMYHGRIAWVIGLLCDSRQVACIQNVGKLVTICTAHQVIIARRPNLDMLNSPGVT